MAIPRELEQSFLTIVILVGIVLMIWSKIAKKSISKIISEIMEKFKGEEETNE